MTTPRAAHTGAGLADRLRAGLAGTGLIRPGDPLAVAISGGLDSVALLHLLRFPLADARGALVALHFDHAMRPGSGADARWVAGLCRAWSVPLVTGRAERPPRSEAEARRYRYAFFEAAAPPDARIATAHHTGDQAETVLFRLLRGTGLRGLRGIAPRRGRVVRPLLGFSRPELEAYAVGNGRAWREDPTNVELRFARNRIRHRVLPELERARPGAARALAALAEQARRAERGWDRALDELARHARIAGDDRAVTLARDILLSYHPHLRARVLRHTLRRYGTVPGRAGTRAALEFISSGRSGGGIDLGHGIRLERNFDRIRIERSAGDEAVDRPLEIPDPGPGSGAALVGGRRYDVWWGRLPDDPAALRAGLGEPRFPLRVRGWRAGDRVRLAYGTKKLKKLFAERRLERRARAAVPVVADAEGRILWVPGHARSEGAGADEGGFQIAVREAGNG